MTRKSIHAIVTVLCLFAAEYALAQNADEETLVGPDSHERSRIKQGHLIGDWGGMRSRLEEKGVTFDLQYISDSLWNLKSEQNERLANWSRVRGTVDIDFGRLAQQNHLYLHVTGLWQGGGKLNQYLGTLASPSGMSSGNTFRLDSWWLEKRWRNENIALRLGQFAGQDFYGAQHFAASFILEPMGYALGNLETTFETFDPPSTPALELRVMPREHFYVKSMVFAADRFQYDHNPTGFVPQFRGAVMNVSEIGFTPGKKANTVRAFDNVSSRKGYSGLYQFGAAYNPGKFVDPASSTPRSGNYLLYWMASQALWRVDRQASKGLDGTLSYDWSPADVNRQNTQLTAGLRYNEPLPLPFHNTMSLGYVRSTQSSRLVSGSQKWQPEHAIEFNALFDVLPMMLIQPVVQYYDHVGGGTHRAIVFGFRTKVDF